MTVHLQECAKVFSNIVSGDSREACIGLLSRGCLCMCVFGGGGEEGGGVVKDIEIPGLLKK